MKKIYTSCLIIILCLVLVSCDLADTPLEKDSQQETEELSGAESRENDSRQDVETDTGIDVDEPSNEAVKNENPQSPQVIITFEKIEDISDLISAGLGTYEEFVKYKQEKNPDILISQEDVQVAAKVIAAFSIPITENSDQVEYLGGNYYIERAELNLYYKVNGIRYCFTYEYGKKSSYKYEGDLVIENAMFGSEKIDIYKVSGGFIGSMMDRAGVVSVRIYSNDKSSVSFENFDFVPISKIVVE